MATDPWNLGRFLEEQDQRIGSGQTVFDDACRQVERGKKTGHWIWYIYPQLVGLGSSDCSKKFALSGVDEARAYDAHPVLGARLREATEAIMHSAEPDVNVIFDDDWVKVRSCMTLVALTAKDPQLFEDVLRAKFRDSRCGETVTRFNAQKATEESR